MICWWHFIDIIIWISYLHSAGFIHHMLSNISIDIIFNWKSVSGIWCKIGVEEYVINRGCNSIYICSVGMRLKKSDYIMLCWDGVPIFWCIKLVICVWPIGIEDIFKKMCALCNNRTIPTLSRYKNICSIEW